MGNAGSKRVAASYEGPLTKEALGDMAAAGLRPACFGAGCFWGTQKFFAKEFGAALSKPRVGYMGGKTTSPTYEAVCTGKTGHAEVLFFHYDPAAVDFADLCRFFFRMHDPTTLNRQGNDRGTQYRSAIFYFDDEQKETAKAVVQEVTEKHFEGDDKAIKTTLEEAKAEEFYEGEPYHQDYLEQNPGGYCNHRLRW